jgi:hypothetical protein
VLHGFDTDLAVEVTLLGVVDPVQEEFDTAGDGSRYVGVRIRLRNVGSTNYDDSPGNGATLVGSNLQQYSETFSTASGTFEGSVALPPSGVRDGMIVFEIPNGVRAATFQLQLESGFADELAEWSL